MVDGEYLRWRGQEFELIMIILKCWSLLNVPKDRGVLSVECVVHVTFHPYNPAEEIVAVNKVIRYKPVHNF